MEPVFLKNNNEILYLMTGDKEKIKNLLQQGYTLLDPATAEGAGEKHLPIVEKTGQKIAVAVGSVFHLMTQVHGIGWGFLETEKGGQIVNLDPGSTPEAEFHLAEGDRAVAAYAYCNLHGLWKMEIYR